MSNITQLPISQSLFLRGLELPNKMAMVYGSDFGYNVLTQLSSRLGPSKSTPNPKVEISSFGDISVHSPVTAAPTTNAAGQLIVTVANPDNFRVGDKVADVNLIQGRVAGKSGSTIILDPTSVSTWNTSTHFQVGNTAKRFFDASANRNSGGKAPLNYVPDTDYTYTAVTRESAAQSRRDRVSSFVHWQGDYWYRSFDQMAMKSLSHQLEFKYAFSELGKFTGTDGERYETAGLRWSIINRGGVYFPTPSKISQASFNEFLENMVRKTNNNGRNLVMLAGSNFIGQLQNITDKYIQYGGNTNTFGGTSVKGLDIMKYSYLGLNIDFVRWGLLDSPMFQSEISSVTGAPRMSSSAYFLDLTPVEAADQSGTMAPFQKYHFNDDELILNYVPGMIGIENSTASSIRQSNMTFATNDIDAVDFHALTDCGMYCIADKMGLIELTA